MLLANLVASRKARPRKSNDRKPRATHARLAARPRKSPAKKAWNKRGLPPLRFARLRSALSILEKRPDGHHVVAYDPSQRERDGPARRAQRRSVRGHEEIRQTRGRRIVREGEEDLDEVVRTSRRRQMRPKDLSEDSLDKIQIEVGSVSGLQAKHGVYRGAFWITLLSLLLWWIPVLGPAVAGYVGGRKAGTPLRGAIAALIPISVAFGALALLSSTTSAVPAAVRNLVEAGYNGVLGSLPFDFPILGYVLGNLAAVMKAGPDALFSVLAFALVGGVVSQMKIQERMVPPISARIPASRLAREPTQVPVRGLDRHTQREVEALLERLNEITAKAGARSPGASGAASPGWSTRPRFSRFFGGGHDLRYSELTARQEAGSQGGLDEASRQVVSGFLASTPPARGDRRFRAAKIPEIDLDMPQTIAFSSGMRPAGAEGPSAAHNFRPSKLYHIYGGSVNPVARAKLEKRLRRTHTLHAMRRGMRSFADMVEVAKDGTVAKGGPDFQAADHPRSLETSALGAQMHYDALEHLENASFETRRKAAPAHPKADEEDLGGLLAHIGADGVAVAEDPRGDDLDFVARPTFDRRGRQRARIAGEGQLTTQKVLASPHVALKKPAPAPALVRETIASVEAQAHAAAPHHEAPNRAQIAKSADRAELTPAQKEKVDRWVKKALADTEAPSKMHEVAKPKAEAPAWQPEQARHAPATHERAAEEVHERQGIRAKPLAPAFEVTHGSTEVDAEAETSETDSKVSKKHRSASDILREIREQRKAEKDAEAATEIAHAAKRAKAQADEIERHARETAAAPIEMVALSSEAPQKEVKAEGAKRRHRSQDLEPVSTEAERLGSDLELTLAPIREERVEIRQVAEHEGSSLMGLSEGIPMVGAPEHTVNLVEAVELASKAAAPHQALEAERDVKPGEVVLAGPSTDVPMGATGEGELSAVDHDRIRRRMQEGWNRL